MAILLGISGDIGSFSEEAALLYAKQKNMEPILTYLLDMESVLNALDDGLIELGIIPVVNNLSGLVKPAFLAMGKYNFTPIDEFWHDINQCLLVKPDTEISQIKCIVSHPQALAQCTVFLHAQFKHLEQIAWIDTAKAAKDLAAGIIPSSCAVIAPARCAQLYNLEIKATNIQNCLPNQTAFLLVKKYDAKETSKNQGATYGHN